MNTSKWEDFKDKSFNWMCWFCNSIYQRVCRFIYDTKGEINLSPTAIIIIVTTIVLAAIICANTVLKLTK